MKIYIAGEHEVKNGSLADWSGIDILESFIYARGNKYFMPLMRHSDVNLILDSGAFTFMSNKDMKLNWERYVDEYCELKRLSGLEKELSSEQDCNRFRFGINRGDWTTGRVWLRITNMSPLVVS